MSFIKAARAEGGGALRFRPTFWPSLAALVTFILLLALGTWQLQRLYWKEELIATRAAQLAAPPAPLPVDAADWRAFDFGRVEVAGAFRHDLEQLFGLRAHEGAPGHHVLTPLVRPDGTAVLVDRGWVPADKAHPASRREGLPAGPVEIRGIARYRADDARPLFRPENDPANRLWFWYDMEALEEAVGLELLPIVVEADGALNAAGLPIGGGTQVELPNNHLQYAITWYGLAAALLGVYIAFSMRRSGNQE